MPDDDECGRAPDADGRVEPAGDPLPETGWFAYAPLSGSVFVPRAQPHGEPTVGASRPDPHAVRLMNDYGARWPLWPRVPDVGSQVRDLLDEALVARLRAWAATFDAHYDPFTGWDDPRVARDHRAEADRLLLALRDALPEPWTVTLDYWETSGA